MLSSNLLDIVHVLLHDVDGVLNILLHVDTLSLTHQAPCVDLSRQFFVPSGVDTRHTFLRLVPGIGMVNIGRQFRLSHRSKAGGFLRCLFFLRGLVVTVVDSSGRVYHIIILLKAEAKAGGRLGFFLKTLGFNRIFSNPIRILKIESFLVVKYQFTTPLLFVYFNLLFIICFWALSHRVVAVVVSGLW